MSDQNVADTHLSLVGELWNNYSPAAAGWVVCKAGGDIEMPAVGKGVAAAKDGNIPFGS